MKEYQRKIADFTQAVQHLAEAALDWSRHPDSGTAQELLLSRYRYSFALAWQSMRDYMAEQGRAEQDDSVRLLLKAASQQGLIADADLWMQMRMAANTLPDLCSSAAVKEAAGQIQHRYLPALVQLSGRYALLLN